MPRWRFSGSVWAKTSASSAWLASEIHIFCPLIRHSPFQSSARVLIDDGSEPAAGSERAKHPSASPSRGASHWRFCSSVPQRSIEPQTSEVWTETTRACRRVAASYLLDDQAVAHVIEPTAAVLLRDQRTQIADLAELASELAVEARRAVVVARSRHDLVVHEVARRLLDQFLFISEFEVDHVFLILQDGAGGVRETVMAVRGGA